jgi:putative flippase GtrA
MGSFITKNNFFEFIRFSIVGIVNTLVNLAVLFILTEFFGVYYIISAIFAFLAAVTNSFILNKIWTFKYKSKKDIHIRYFQFLIVSIIAFIVNMLILYVFTEYFNFYYMLSQIIGVACNLIINFLGNKLWTFKR